MKKQYQSIVSPEEAAWVNVLWLFHLSWRQLKTTNYKLTSYHTSVAAPPVLAKSCTTHINLA